LLGQAIAASLRFGDRLNQLLEGDLARGRIKALRRKPQAMFARPVAAAGVDAPVTKEKAQNLLGRATQRLHCSLPGAAKIAHGFVRVVGNPDRRQFARAKQRGLRDCVAAVRLHAVSRPDRNERRRDHHTFMSELRDLSIKPIAARAGFVAEGQLAMLGRQTLHQFSYRIRPAGNLPDKSRFAPPAFDGQRHRDRVLVRIHRHIGRRTLVHGSFPMHEALVDSSTNPRRCMPWNEPPKRT
jgi:hypothetical protein